MEVNETLNGYEIRGNWQELVEVINKLDQETEELNELSSWKPTEKEDLSDLKQKTIQETTIDQNHEVFELIKKLETLVFLFILFFNKIYFSGEEFSVCLYKKKEDVFVFEFVTESTEAEEVLEQETSTETN